MAFIDSIGEKALKHYSAHSETMRNCPNSDCDYVGFVELSKVTDRIDCEKPFECEKCHVNWSDPLQRKSSWQEELRYYLGGYMGKVAENIVKVNETKLCPNCLVPIQKNGGCDKVDCAKCKYEFWWQCLLEYKRYRHDPETRHLHPTSIIVKILTWILIIIPILARIIMNWITSPRAFQVAYTILATLSIDIWVFFSIVISIDSITDRRWKKVIPKIALA